MTDSDQSRYLFTVRQLFGETPRVDTFYELKVPAGITSDQAKVMTKLNKDWCKEEITEDTSALVGMQLRIRFNSDTYPHVCIVRTHTPITCETLESIIQTKHVLNELMTFLDESAIK